MTKLIIRFSDIYDQTLARCGPVLPGREISNPWEFAEAYRSYWDQFNNKFFSHCISLGFSLPPVWPIYLVNARGFYPFSDPITLTFQPDHEALTAVLVHELFHMLLVYEENEPLWRKLIDHVDKTYHREDWDTRVHIIVNVLTQDGVRLLYGQKTCDELLSAERGYNLLKRAWEILDAKPNVCSGPDPIRGILSL